MRYVLVLADGELQVTGGGENAHLEDIGPEGATRIPLNPLPDLPPITGWVNSAGSSAYPVNPLGGGMLVNLGAPAGDYFGPVCVTGWDGVNGIGINSDMSAIITAAYEQASQ